MSDKLSAAVINYSRIPIWEKRGVILFNFQKLFSITGLAIVEKKIYIDRKRVIKSAEKNTKIQRARSALEELSGIK